MSKIGKIRAILKIVDSAVELRNYPYPASIANTVLVQMQALKVARLNEEEFNDDGTINTKTEDRPSGISNGYIHGTGATVAQLITELEMYNPDSKIDVIYKGTMFIKD